MHRIKKITVEKFGQDDEYIAVDFVLCDDSSKETVSESIHFYEGESVEKTIHELKRFADNILPQYKEHKITVEKFGQDDEYIAVDFVLCDDSSKETVSESIHFYEGESVEKTIHELKRFADNILPQYKEHKMKKLSKIPCPMCNKKGLRYASHPPCLWV